MQLKELTDYLDQWAPPTYAEDFDNVGLLVGNPQQEINGVLITLDCLEEVVQEAIDLNFNCIITFHPIIFKGLKSITGKNYVEKAVIKAIKNDIAIYAIHTNLDVVKSGVNAMIAEKLQLQNTQILIPKKNTLYKLVTYVPKESVNQVLEALYDVGAGQIGNYSDCSFQTVGLGSFTPNENANPVVGEREKPEQLEEQKVEVIVAQHLLPLVENKLKESHPYEEVAYEIFPTVNANQDLGMGMIGELEEEMTSEQFLDEVKNQFNAKGIRHSKISENKIKKVAVLGGSGSFAISSAMAQKADVFLSADFKYHDFFQAESKILLVDIGHYESEQYTKNLIFEYITKKFRNFAIQISNINTNPIYYYS